MHSAPKMSKATLILFPAMLELSLSAYLLWKLWLERIKPIVLWDIFHGSLIPPCKFSAEPNAYIQPWFASFMVYAENRNHSRLRITRILTKKAGYDDQESVDDDRTVSVSAIKPRILSPKPTQLHPSSWGEATRAFTTEPERWQIKTTMPRIIRSLERDLMILGIAIYFCIYLKVMHWGKDGENDWFNIGCSNIAHTRMHHATACHRTKYHF